jgi:glutamate 5-kinase
MNQTRKALAQTRRWVVKIGSALATNNGQGLRLDSIDVWAAQAAQLCRAGYEIVLVTSGSVAEGVVRLGWKARPHTLDELQAAAAVGQMGLVQAYEACFQKQGLRTAQILLTHEDFFDRRRYLNAWSTFRTLLSLGVVPLVNENDTVATDEIQFGDNDTLAGLVANLVEARLLVILTDQEGLFERDPRKDPTAKLVTEARAGDPSLAVMAGRGGAWGRGGMQTKLGAAALAARFGTTTIIASGQAPEVLVRIAQGEQVGTRLTPTQEPLTARKQWTPRKQWLAGGIRPRGKLTLDEGAVRALREAGCSLLPVGVTAVEGKFTRGELVICVDPSGTEIARGLVNYSAAETRRIMGQPSDRIEALLGYIDESELIHRDNLVVIDT